MLAKELRQEFKEKDEEFHVNEPRRLFLETIANIIRKSSDRQAKLYDFRGRLKLFRLMVPIDYSKRIEEAYSGINGWCNFKISQTGNLVYDEGRTYLEVTDEDVGRTIRFDVTEESFGQIFITSDDMLENRLKILKEEGFVVEEGEEEFKIELPIDNSNFLRDPSYPDGNPRVSINIFKIKL